MRRRQPAAGAAGHRTLLQAIDAVRSGGKVVGVSWFGGAVLLDVDRLRERSLCHLFPDISTLDTLQHTVRLAATITHVLRGRAAVSEAFGITANKGKHRAINPAQVVLS